MTRRTRGQISDGLGEALPSMERCTFCGSPRRLITYGDLYVCRGCVREMRARFLQPGGTRSHVDVTASGSVSESGRGGH